MTEYKDTCKNDIGNVYSGVWQKTGPQRKWEGNWRGKPSILSLLRQEKLSETFQENQSGKISGTFQENQALTSGLYLLVSELLNFHFCSYRHFCMKSPK